MSGSNTLDLKGFDQVTPRTLTFAKPIYDTQKRLDDVSSVVEQEPIPRILQDSVRASAEKKSKVVIVYNRFVTRVSR